MGALLRSWQIGDRPGYEWDEPVYMSVASNVAHHGQLQAITEYGAHQSSYLFHPPFYFLGLGAWFKLVGSGITQARVVAAAMSLIAIVLLFFFLRGAIGRLPALVTVTFVTLDSWMVFSNRVSWIENSLIVFVVLAVWMYQRAMSTNHSSFSFALAGVLVGVAIVVKYTGVYVLAAVLINWFINRSDVRLKRRHLLLILSALSVVVAYLAAMTLIYQHGSSNVFWHDTWIQMQRTFVSSNDTRGSLQLHDLWRPLTQQYKIFVGTVIVTVGSLAVLVYRLVQCVRARTLVPVREHSLLFSWFVAALAVFGVAQLKFPQYFELVLIPAYAFVVAEGLALLRQVRPYQVIRLRSVYCTIAMAIIALGLCGFWWRIVDHHDNALKSLARYSATTIPRNHVVITEEPIGMIIPQPYCKMFRAAGCGRAAKYVMTYESYTEHIPNIPALRALLQHSTPVKVITGFKEKLTVWRVDARQ